MKHDNLRLTISGVTSPFLLQLFLNQTLLTYTSGFKGSVLRTFLIFVQRRLKIKLLSHFSPEYEGSGQKGYSYGQISRDVRFMGEGLGCKQPSFGEISAIAVSLLVITLLAMPDNPTGLKRRYRESNSKSHGEAYFRIALAIV